MKFFKSIFSLKKGSINKRHSTSANNGNSFSSIPVRKNSQKSTTKKNSSSTLQNEEVTNDKALRNELIEEISIENTKNNTKIAAATSPESALNNHHSTGKISSQKSRSKLPVRK